MVSVSTDQKMSGQDDQLVGVPHHDDTSSSSSSSSLIQVPTHMLLLSTVPLLFMALLSSQLHLQLESPIVVGILRTLVQLTLLGTILSPIFTFGMHHVTIVLAYVFAMMIIASLIVTNGRTKYLFVGMMECVLCSIIVNVTGVSVFAFGILLPPTPRWNPQYVIPIVGMLLGNCINGVALSLNTLLTMLKEDGPAMELLLSFGASTTEASQTMVQESIRIGAMPMLNSMAVIGLISIPGMMTGQILSGSPVMEAAKYQMLIMILIATCTFGTILLQVYMVTRYIAFDPIHETLCNDLLLVQKSDQGSFLQQVRHVMGYSYRSVVHYVSNGWRYCGRRRRGRSPWWRSSLAGSTASSSSSSTHASSTRSSSGGLLPVSEMEPLSNTTIPESYVAPKGQLEIVTMRQGTDSIAQSLMGDTTEGETAVNSSRISDTSAFSKDTGVVLELRDVSRSVGTISPSSSPFRSSPTTDSSDSSLVYQTLFRNVSVRVRAGDIVAVRGPSGTGKSQLLRVIAGLSPMDEEDEEDDEEEEDPDRNGKDKTEDSPTGASEEASGVQGPSSKPPRRRLGDMFLNGKSRMRDYHKKAAHWRRQIRYVSQYKVDIMGTPTDFVRTVSSLASWKEDLEFSHHSRTSQLLSSITSHRSNNSGGGGIPLDIGEDDANAIFPSPKVVGIQDSAPSSHSRNSVSTSTSSRHSPPQMPSFSDMMTQCIELIQQWGLTRSCMDTEWKLLSGGQAQRIYLAIAIASRPRVLLLDESTASLDLDSKLRVEQSIQLVAAQTGTAIIWITHDDEQIQRMGPTLDSLGNQSTVPVSRSTI